MGYFHNNIEKITLENNNYRKVLFTGKYMQLVLMNIPPRTEIGTEIHNDIDQFIRVESGEGILMINDEIKTLSDGIGVIIPAGLQHNIINNSNIDLKLYSIYTPPEHPKDTIQKIKPEFEEHFEIISNNNLLSIISIIGLIMVLLYIKKN
jgi:mannose-6-phosphate isomerase-like protein (cupin superfamily)